MFEAERECGRPCPLRLSETGKTSLFLSFFFPVMEDVIIQVIFCCVLLGRSEWQRSLLPDFSHSSWAVDSKLAAELCSRWQSHKDKLPCRLFLNLTHTQKHTLLRCVLLYSISGQH